MAALLLLRDKVVHPSQRHHVLAVLPDPVSAAPWTNATPLFITKGLFNTLHRRLSFILNFFTIFSPQAA